jgi:hypothetical protein
MSTMATILGSLGWSVYTGYTVILFYFVTATEKLKMNVILLLNTLNNHFFLFWLRKKIAYRIYAAVGMGSSGLYENTSNLLLNN